MNWAYEQTVKPSTRKFVLVSLANFADENGYCFPSQQTIASMTDQGVSTVREHLSALEADGFISREHRYAETGGGRASDGFWLQAPKDRLKPPVKKLKSIPPKAGGMGASVRKHSAEKDESYRQVTAELPPKAGGDHIRTLNDPLKEPSPHARLMEFHSQHLKGPIPDGGAQGAAIKWLLASYKPETCEACYESLLNDKWRSKVSWLTVKSEIGSWLARQPEAANGSERIVADYGDWYLVESSCGDGGTSPRYRTPEAFARETGRDLAIVKAGWN